MGDKLADLTLVILAAGLGTRFGGDKQLAALGPNGETMLELSLKSAYKAGFNRAAVLAVCVVGELIPFIGWLGMSLIVLCLFIQSNPSKGTL